MAARIFSANFHSISLAFDLNTGCPMLPGLPVMLASIAYLTTVSLPASTRWVVDTADDAERRPLCFRLDALGRRQPRDLHAHREGEVHVGDLGVQNRIVMSGVDLLEIAHAFRAGCEERRVPQDHTISRGAGRVISPLMITETRARGKCRRAREADCRNTSGRRAKGESGMRPTRQIYSSIS
jgi:hypothetical protein